MAPPTRDFAKRPKAKVGKRAPAKINATDTSFKTASVAVRSQGQSLDKNKNAIGAKQAQGKDAVSSAAARMELASSRGNALSTLQASLRHHAAPVRASGLRGIRDAVQSLSSLEDTLGSSILEANLPSLLPNMCRCWLDEDDDARSLAINLFGDILKNLKSSTEQSDLKCLAPFVPFLCAYTSSALNSLDRSIRKDGALIVAMLASSEASPSFSSLSSSLEKAGGISAMSAKMGEHVDIFIPPLERLLSSISFGRRDGSAGSREGKKRKRDSNNATQTGASLAGCNSTLLSLALLLRSSLVLDGSDSHSSSSSGSTGTRLDPSLYVSGECTYLKGGSANSLLLIRQTGSNLTNMHKPIRGIVDLPFMSADELIDDIDNTQASEGDVLGHSSITEKDTTKLEKLQRMTSLLETLRLKFVELTHSGRKSSNDKDGLIMSTADLENVDVLVQTIRSVHHRYQSFQSTEDQFQSWKQTNSNSTAKRQPQKRQKKAMTDTKDIGESLAAYKAIVTKTLTFLLETFPVCPMDNVSASRYELTNAGICSVLAELGGDNMFESDRGPSSQWMNSVFSYIIPRLNSISESKETTTETRFSSTEGVATNMLLKVVSKLLLPHALSQDNATGKLTQNYLLNNPLKRHELLEAFAGSFFPRLSFPSIFKGKEQSGSFIYRSSTPADVKQKIEQLASTAMGKTAAILLTTLIAQSARGILDPSNEYKNELCEKKSILLLQMSSVLPIYLISWEGRLPAESGMVLASLIAIARQWSESMDPNKPDGSTISSSERALSDLCFGLRCTLESLYTTSKKKRSIFERLPEQVQKLSVGLTGLLKFPSEALAKSLSKICSNSFDPRRVSSDAEEVAVISAPMANYCMEVMHSLRKTMPMPRYLTFLIDSCGMRYASGTLLQQKRINQDGDVATTDPFSETVFFFDRSVGQLCRFLTTSCDGASKKVLPMIRPILQNWLSATSSASGNDVIQQLVQSRAAISILAAFAWDEILSSHLPIQSSTGFVGPKFLDLDETLDSLVVNCIIDQFELTARLWSMEGGVGGGYDIMDDLEVQQQYLARLLGPITLLLRYRHGMFDRFLEEICRRVVVQRSQESKGGQQEECHSEGANGATQEGVPSNRKIDVVEVHMKALLLVLKSKEPASFVDLVRGSDNGLEAHLLSTAENIQKSVAGGHLGHLGSKLMHQANLCKR